MSIQEIFEFQCKICFQQFNNYESVPMIICPNAHFACLACLRQFKQTNQKYSCPFCKKTYEVGHAIPFRKLLQLKKVKNSEKKLNGLIKANEIRLQIQQIKMKQFQSSISRLRTRLRETHERECEYQEVISILISELSMVNRPFIKRPKEKQLQQEISLSHEQITQDQNANRQSKGEYFHQLQKELLTGSKSQMNAYLKSKKFKQNAQAAIYDLKQFKQKMTTH